MNTYLQFCILEIDKTQKNLKNMSVLLKVIKQMRPQLFNATLVRLFHWHLGILVSERYAVGVQ